MKLGILFIGHGTRLVAGVYEFAAFVSSAIQEIGQQFARLNSQGLQYANPDWFGGCFLELQEPTISDAIETAVSNGCDAILAVPVFLFAAAHIKVDIPRELAAARKKYSGLSIICTAPFGPDGGLVDACTDRLLESGWNPELHRACIIFVSRGGKDENAREQFGALVSQIANRIQIDVAKVKRVFMAGRGPSLNDALVECLRERFRVVYVIPVLLFQGQLVTRLGTEIHFWNQQAIWNGMTIVFAPHLRNHPSLVKRITAKAIESIDRESVVQ